MKNRVLVWSLLFLLTALSHIHAITYEDWQAAHFTPAELADPSISGEAANPAGDGLSNLLKYAFDLDPHAPTIEGAPAPQFFGSALALNFLHRPDASALDYALEASSDLFHWSVPNGLHLAATLPLGDVEQWTVLNPYPWPADLPQFLRLRVTRTTTPLLLLDPPQIVRVRTTSPPLGLELHWADRSNAELGYRVERQRAAEGWELFGITGPDTIFYPDHTVQRGTTYAYRVRALFAGGLFSAWSESGGAIPQSPGTGGGTGDPAPPDPDPDTDEDTFKDSVDAYPHDKRRSRDLPTLTYAEIDLSTPVIGTVSVHAVALGDDNKAAFLYGESPTYHSVTWENGTASSPNNFPAANGSEDGPGWTWEPEFVWTSGAVAGSGTKREGTEGQINQRFGVAICQPGGEPAFQHLTGGSEGWGGYLGGFPGGALLWGLAADGSGDPYYIGSTTFSPTPDGTRFIPQLVSMTGQAVGSYGAAPFARYTEGTPVALTAKAVFALGDNGTIFGVASGAPPDTGLPGGSLPAKLWSVSDGTAQDVAPLLPSEFRKQIAFNENTTAQMNSAGDILFTTKTLEGPEDAPVWNEKYILWTRQATTASPNGTLAQVSNPGQQLNAHGLMVDTDVRYPLNPETGEPDTTQEPYLAAILKVPVELAPNPIPITGVARGRVFLAGANKDTMPILGDENAPIIKIGNVVCENIHQDEIDPRVFYFTPPGSPNESADKFDFELSGITVPGYPFLADGLPLKFEKFIEYTDDAQQGTKGFMDSNLVGLDEAQSFIAQADENGTLTDEEANSLLNGYGDKQARDQSSLAKVFFADKQIDQEEVHRYERALDRNTAQFEADYPVTAPNEPSYVFPTGVTVQAVTRSIAEGSDAVIRFWRPDATFPAQIAYTLSGTATAGTDFPAQTGTLTFSGSDLSVDLTIAITADANVEATETLIATVTPGAYAVGFFDKATVYLSDSAAEAEAVLPALPPPPGQLQNAGPTPPAPSGPRLGTATFFTEAKELLAASASKVLQGTSAYTNPDGHVGLMHYLVFSADDLKLKTVVNLAEGNTIGDIQSANANANAKIILNGALFNYKDIEPFVTIGRVLSGGSKMNTSTTPSDKSYEAASKRYWFGQTFDKSATKNNGHALSYEFGHGHPPEGGQIDKALGGLISLIYPNGHAQTPQDDADLDVYEAGWFNKPSGNINKRVRGAVARLVPFNIIGVDRNTGLLIIVSKPYKQPILLKDAQQALVGSGVDLALITDGGGSVACWAQGWPHNGGYLSREKRHVGVQEKKETVTNYLIFEP